MAVKGSRVARSKFRPFSYQEMLAPVIMATQQQQQIEDQMGELDAKSSIFEGLTDAQRDTISHKRFTDFSTQLKQQSEALASQGLNPNTRRELSKLRASYAQHIAPIEQAYARRRQLADEQRKAKLSDPTLMFSAEMSNTSLDRFLQDPEYTSQSMSGKMIAQQASIQAASLAKQLKDNPRKWESILGKQYYETVMQKGFTPEEVMLAAQGNPNAPKELTQIINNVIGSSGMANWADSNQMKQARQYAAQGLYSAIGGNVPQILQDRNFMSEYQKAEAGARAKNEAGENPRYRTIPTTRTNDTNSTQAGEDLKFIQSLLKDPSLLKKTETRTTTAVPTSTGTGPYTGFNRTYEAFPNAERLKKLGEKYNIAIDSTQGVQLVGAKLQEQIAKSATRELGYISNLTDQKKVQNVLSQNMRVALTSRGRVNSYYVEDGEKTKDRLSQDDFDSIFSGTGELYVHPRLGFVWSYTNSKGKTGAITIDPEMISSETVNVNGKIVNRYQDYINRANQAIEIGNLAAAGAIMHGLADEIPYHYTTQTQVQTTTGKQP